MRIHPDKVLALALLGFAAGCQDPEFTEPTDEPTGTPAPAATQVYHFDAASSPRYLDANLEATSAVTAEFTVVDGQLVAIPEAGGLPAEAGADADLRGGVGFGTYPNPDLRGPAVDWAGASAFQAVLNAEITLHSSGDGVTFCRSFSATCATVALDPLGTTPGVGVVILTVAGNVPDTEIGEIAPGVSAAIRGTGDSGLTVAVTDESQVALPFLATPGEPVSFSWTTARGDTVGSLDWSVTVNDNALGDGNTAAMLATAITKDHGAALVFDPPVATGDVFVSYDYTFDGGTPDLTPVFELGAAGEVEGDLHADPDLAYAPLFVFPTTDPPWAIGGTTLDGGDEAPHVVRAEDGVTGELAAPAIPSSQWFVYSVAFDGDDFAGTPLEGMVDQGGAGGGFYPSPSFCYAQILPVAHASVVDGVHTEVHRQMYANIANGVAASDASLEALVAGLNANFGQSLTYTRVGDVTTGDIDGYVTIGTDYADTNLQANVSTSQSENYDAELTEPISETFLAELNAILGTLEANDNQIRDALIGANQLTMEQYLGLKTLQGGLTTPFGAQETVEGNIEVIFRDVVNGTNISGENPTAPVPALAGGCQWGVPPAPEMAAVEATLTPNLADPETYDQGNPAYPAEPAVPATPPVRETAAASMNTLVQGLYSGFVEAAYGPTVPASNFSLRYDIGAEGPGPSVSSITITKE